MRRFLKLRRISKLGRRQEGAAAVEFALCLIPLLLIVGGIVDFGQAWYMESMLATASREGARHATRYTVDPGDPTQRLVPDAANVANYVKGKYLSLLPDLEVNLTSPVSTAAGTQVSVTTTAPKEWFFLGHLVPGLPSQLSSTTWMALE
jgi:Flp pilus assembly protein TadG